MEKTDLLLLHAAMGAASQYDPLVPLLQENFNVWTLDFEGHGRRAMKERPFRSEYFSENVLEMMDENGLASVNIFGYSLGGYIGLLVARSHPDRVCSVFTFATKSDWTPSIAAKEAGYLDPERILLKVPQFAETLKKRHPASGWRDVMAKTKEFILRQGDTQSLSEADYSQLQLPIRLSIGDRDKMVTIEETLAVYRKLPNAQLQILPGTLHPIEQTDPGLLAAAINSFFSCHA